jgi:DNA-binding transcriptional regulator GbsR (MarR family)
MKYQEGKSHFIESWGNLSTNWGIPKTMGQVHALLLISPKALNADEIMEELDISRGSANKNIHALLEWGLLLKIEVKGDRKDYFNAVKDFWDIFKKIINQRKKKELDPMIDMLENISKVDGLCHESKEFCKVVSELRLFSNKADQALTNMTSSRTNWLIDSYLKMVR